MKFQRPLATAVLSLAICMSVVAQNTVFQARVIQVVDGTTVVVETQSKSQFHVKCLGAAAPSEQDSFGVESKQRLSALILDKTVTVESSKRDENGNLLASIRLDNQDVCLDQIRLGLAWLEPDAAARLSSSERRLYSTAESMARVNALGVWTAETKAPQNASGTAAKVIEQSASITSPASTQPSGDSPSLTTGNSTASTVDVRGYFRKDGTYVPPHKRTKADGSFDDNWSTVGNVNPNTGEPGRKSWLRRNWWIFPTVGALIGTGYLVHRYSSGTGGGIPCVDGTISQAQNRQGACSHHGGIRK
jgi:endonuclease YncB( thermonuclease family)